MTTGQPIKYPMDANKFSNEYNESLQLQIDLNQKNLDANRLYIKTGQLPPNVQMADMRTNEEKLADIETLKRSIISDLAPIAEPMFASAVIQGVMSSPLNVNNSLFRYLAQNASTFATTLSKKYKFGIAGDANDVEVMVQFLEDAFNRTKNNFQSIKGYIESNTNQGNKTKSNILSANDTDNIITELKNGVKRLEFARKEYIEKAIDPNVRQNIPRVDTAVYRIENIMTNVLKFLPTSNQLQNIINNTINSVYDQELRPFRDEEILYATLKILQTLPRPSTVATLIDNIDKNLRTLNNPRDAPYKASYRLILENLSKIEQLFATFLSTQNDAILVQFHDQFLTQARDELAAAERIDRINTIHNIEAMNQNQERDARAQRVYIVNPDTDPVNVSSGGDNFSLPSVPSRISDLTGPSFASSAPSDITNPSYGSSAPSDISNPSFGSRAPSIISDSTGSYESSSDGNYPYPTATQIALGALAGVTLGGIYAANRYSNPRTSAALPRMSEFDRQLEQQSPYVPRESISIGRVPQPNGDVPNYPPPPPPAIVDLIPPLQEPVPMSPDQFGARRNYVANANGQVDSEYINNSVNRLSGNQLKEAARYVADNPGQFATNGIRKNSIDIIKAELKRDRPSTLKLKTALKTILANLPGYNPNDGRANIGIGGLGVKKGRGLYKPFGDTEINHKNLDKGILTIRRKTKSNIMDLPSKKISKNLQNIIRSIMGGKVANYEDIHNLSDEEKDYLHKIVGRANLHERLSVPAPSKDQQEKDAHQWEVQRGEIMSGNDSKELVKSFKLLTMKLTRQGLLPKNEVLDLFHDLVSLGY